MNARDAPARAWAALCPGSLHPQARDGGYQALNVLLGSAAGLLFWLVAVRGYGFPAAEVGAGLALISASTALALVAKGGLDAALVRHVPGVPPREGARLLALAATVGALGVAVAAGVLALAPAPLGVLAALVPGGGLAALALAVALAVLLQATWLLDAYLLARGEARRSFHRHVVLHGARMLAPVPAVALALPFPIAVAWALALAASALAAALWARGTPRPVPGPAARAADPRPAPSMGSVRGGSFLRTASRNLAAGTGESLPGLLVVPLVLALRGPVAAAHAGMAWAAASTVFLLSAALARSAFAAMSRGAPPGPTVRLAVRHHLRVVVPATAGALALAPLFLGLLGPDYAREGLPLFVLLAASVPLVATVNLHLALLRSGWGGRGLVAYPAALLGLLVAIAPPLVERLGPLGVGAAWLAAYAPWALLAAPRLAAVARDRGAAVGPARAGRVAGAPAEPLLAPPRAPGGAGP